MFGWLNRPKTIRAINFWLTITWVFLAIPTVLWWKQSILWVAVASIYANVVSHYTAYLTARVEVREEDVQEALDDVA